MPPTHAQTQDHRLVALLLAARDSKSDADVDAASRRLRAFLQAAERFRAAILLQKELRAWVARVKRKDRNLLRSLTEGSCGMSNTVFFQACTSEHAPCHPSHFADYGHHGHPLLLSLSLFLSPYSTAPCALQASDHGREDFKSNLVAAFTLTIGLSQVVAMSPFVPEPPGGIGGIRLLEYSLPFGIGHALVSLQETLPAATSPGLEPLQTVTAFGAYVAYGAMWCLINVANVKGHHGLVWPKVLSTSVVVLYLLWIFFQTEFPWYARAEHARAHQ